MSRVVKLKSLESLDILRIIWGSKVCSQPECDIRVGTSAFDQTIRVKVRVASHVFPLTIPIITNVI